MALYKTIGGDRLGSGKRMKAAMKNYERSNHNLSRKITTSMCAGTLIPTYCNVGLLGDKFKVTIDSLVKTIPTIAPLFGSFKFQTDLFFCPTRLYQGILHNNPLNIGLNMKNVLYPVVNLTQASANNQVMKPYNYSSLAKYLGLSGLGYGGHKQTAEARTYTRMYNAIPFLAYYDIFKCYYSNKQEEQAYFIGNKQEFVLNSKMKWLVLDSTYHTQTWNYEEFINNSPTDTGGESVTLDGYTKQIRIETTQKNWQQFYMSYNGSVIFDLAYYTENPDITAATDGEKTLIVINNVADVIMKYASIEDPDDINWSGLEFFVLCDETNELKINSFDLENIDTMRYTLLSNNTIGDFYNMTEADIEPYKSISKMFDNYTSFNHFPMAGICLKTYQSDIFNNWLNTEWIDGDNGITELTKIDVTDGLTMDALNLGQKIYNMMNRIAISGGTYEDWLEAVWGEEVVRRCESPMYLGGMSTEIVFQEVVATTSAEVGGKEQALGTLAGKGTQIGKKGGYIEFKCSEPGFIIAISSITPRVSYYQGNDWYLTELKSEDDLHKPELDGIGFQDLITEQMAYFDTFDGTVAEGGFVRNSAGKQPAWLNYMTDYDRVYGDFCDNNKAGYMVLKREYDVVDLTNSTTPAAGTIIKDLTTYIDPTKYNYAFADQTLEAQNFWVQLAFNIEVRRKMSARIIPNL